MSLRPVAPRVGLTAWVVLAGACGVEGPPTPDHIAAAAGAVRTIRPRLSGSFAYARCVRPDSASPITDAICEHRIEPSTEQRLAPLSRKIFLASSTDTVAAATLHTQARWNLLWPRRPFGVDSAVAWLRRAHERNETNADVLNDLAASLLSRAALQDDPRDAFDALAAANRAVDLDPDALAARWNRALALQTVAVYDAADSAWATYLDEDDGSPWAAEARRYRAALRRTRRVASGAAVEDSLADALRHHRWDDARAIARANPATTRHYVITVLLGGWARISGATPNPNDTNLEAARLLAEVLITATGDRMLVDGIDTIESALAAGNRARIAGLAAGHRAMADGIDLHGRTRFNAAGAASDAAFRHLRDHGSPMAELAAFHRARNAYQRGAYDASIAILESSRQRIGRSDYRTVLGLTYSLEGLIHNVTGAYAFAHRSYSLARDLFEGGEIDGHAEARSGLAYASHQLGAERNAWRHAVAALGLSWWAEFDRTRYRILLELSGRASEYGYPGLAAHIAGSAVRMASQTGDTLALLSALHRQITLDHQLHGPEATRATHDRIVAITDAIPDQSTRAQMRSLQRLILGDIESTRDPGSALRHYRHAIRGLREHGYALSLPQALVGLARAHHALGQPDLARPAFFDAVQELERQRGLVDNPTQRVEFLDRLRPVLDGIVEFEVTAEDPHDAFEFVEAMRARVLLERFAEDTGRDTLTPLGAADIRARLRDGEVLISYTVTDTSLFAWIITRDTIHLHPRSLDPDMLRSQIERLRAVGRHPMSSEFREAAGALYDMLIAPLRSFLPSQSRLVIVPDRWLHFVPFHALWDADGGAYLVQQYEPVVVPSASIYVTLGRGPPSNRTGPTRMFAVGNPTFDDSLFALGDLPFAEREATRVAALYEGATTLTGHAATSTAFLQRARTHDVIHFAGHAVVDPTDARRSFLLLADTPDDPNGGTLRVTDLSEHRFGGTGLVILSGCHTAGGRMSATEGPTSLARAFFAAGVPAVIATQWSVDDRDASEFAVDLHRELVQGHDPAIALRRAQLRHLASMVAGEATGTAWAAFQYMGVGEPR